MANQFENQKLADLKTDNQQKFFQNVFEKNNGNWSAIKTDLAGKEGFTTAAITNANGWLLPRLSRCSGSSFFNRSTKQVTCSLL